MQVDFVLFLKKYKDKLTKRSHHSKPLFSQRCAVRTAHGIIYRYNILVPRAYDASGLRQESRALGTTILGMRRCRLRETGWAEFGYFLCFFKMIGPRALVSCRRPEGS